MTDRRRRRGLAAVVTAAVLAGLAGLATAQEPAAAATTPGSGCGQAALVAVNAADNNLYRWTRSTPTSGSFTSAAKVGIGWSDIRLTASDERTGDLFAVDRSGNLKRFWWGGSAYTGGDVIGYNWGPATQIVSAGNGVIYAVWSDGSLRWFHWLGTGSGGTGWDTSNGLYDTGVSPAKWSTRNGAVIGSGWNTFSMIASGGNGVLYGIRKSDGALVWYRNVYPGMGTANWKGGTVVGSGWGTTRALVGLGGGVLYAVNASGKLMQYTHAGYQTGAATWGNNGVGIEIGSGWIGFSRITANPQACAPAAPTRADGVDEPVYFVHGLSNPLDNGWNCNSYWGNAEVRYATLGWTAPLRTIGYYSGDSNCDVVVTNGTTNLPIENVARSFAWWVYQHHSQFGQGVQVVGHSLGGIIVRAAITGVEQGSVNGLSGFPPYLYIENVATLESPHQGGLLAAFCPSRGYTQCEEIAPNSTFLKSLGWNPQSKYGTDWTLISTEDDDMVGPFSGIATNSTMAGYMQVGHIVRYDAGQFGAPDLVHGTVHMNVLWNTGSTGYSLWHGEAGQWSTWGTAAEAAGDTPGPDLYGYYGWTFKSRAPGPVDAAFAATRYWTQR